jgi:pimeloyl-ACP methyl ester carboxylesterase
MGAIFSSANEKDEDPLRDELRRDPILQRRHYPRLDGETLTLPDGPRLGYAKCGATAASEARTILFLHGTPGTRFSWHEGHSERCAQAGIQVVVPERPGFGLSSPRRNRSLLSHAEDMAVLLDHLNLWKVVVVGYGAGGPYALALAYRIPDRCSKVAVVSSLSPPKVSGQDSVTIGMSPLSKFGYMLARKFPAALRVVVAIMAIAARRVVFDPTRDDYTEEENSLFRADIGQRRLMAASTLELYSRNYGARAESDDYALFGRDWGFELSQIPSSVELFVYGGDCDDKFTPNIYKLIVQSCPNVSRASHLAKGEGHLFYFKHFSSLLQDLGLV